MLFSVRNLNEVFELTTQDEPCFRGAQPRKMRDFNTAFSKINAL